MSAFNYSKYTFLIAEDDMISYKYLARLLSDTGAEIIHKTDGVGAFVECLNNDAIDLVLMDLKMMGIDGLDATKLIKKYRPQIKIIAQTAYAQIGDKEKCLKFGCDSYIAKPYTPEDLLNKIDLLLE